ACSRRSQRILANIEIAHAAVAIDLGGGASRNSACDPQPGRRPDGNFTADEVELVPCVPALDVNIGAESKRIDPSTDRRLERGNRSQVDEGDDLIRRVRKAMAMRVQQLRRTSQLVATMTCYEGFYLGAALRCRQAGADRLASFSAHRENMRRIVKARLKCAKP